MIHSSLIQINALVHLRRLQDFYGRKSLTLVQIPDEDWKRLVARGYEYVWLMGVWERSPLSAAQALACEPLKKAFDTVLPGWRPEQVAGSPYAIKSYTLDGRLGQEGDLAKLKKKLNKLGLKLILDFVPNHLAMDHAWMRIPDRFIRGSEEKDRLYPGLFFRHGPSGPFTAHGKDPFFPPWSDTAQLNVFSEKTREALSGELMKIADVCDGVRCDMAMLLLNRIFEKNWFPFLEGMPRPRAEFWPAAIDKVKHRYPGFKFIAEVYWDLERELQSMGFDLTYDKKFYDLLKTGTGRQVRQELRTDTDFQERLVRFVENHDEPRALEAFGEERSFAAAAAVMTLPGFKLVHDGQLEGRTAHLPVQIDRQRPELPQVKVTAFYDRLFSYLRTIDLVSSDWKLWEAVPNVYQADDSWQDILCWSWEKKGARHLVMINYAPTRSEGRIFFPKSWPMKGRLQTTNKVSGSGDRPSFRKDEDGASVVSLGPWRVLLFNLGA